MIQVQIQIVEQSQTQVMLSVLAREDATPAEREMAKAIEAYCMIVFEKLRHTLGASVERIEAVSSPAQRRGGDA